VDVIEGMTGGRLKGRVNDELAVGGGAKQDKTVLSRCVTPSQSPHVSTNFTRDGTFSLQLATLE
jgi:hypothetical protein